MPLTSPNAAPPKPASSKPRPTPRVKKMLLAGAIVVVASVVGVVAWAVMRHPGPGAAFVSGNGRIEATEVDVATKLAGRVKAIMVNVGDFVERLRLGQTTAVSVG